MNYHLDTLAPRVICGVYKQSISIGGLGGGEGGSGKVSFGIHYTGN